MHNVSGLCIIVCVFCCFFAFFFAKLLLLFFAAFFLPKVIDVAFFVWASYAMALARICFRLCFLYNTLGEGLICCVFCCFSFSFFFCLIVLLISAYCVWPELLQVTIYAGCMSFVLLRFVVSPVWACLGNVSGSQIFLCLFRCCIIFFTCVTIHICCYCVWPHFCR